MSRKIKAWSGTSEFAAHSGTSWKQPTTFHKIWWTTTSMEGKEPSQASIGEGLLAHHSTSIPNTSTTTNSWYAQITAKKKAMASGVWLSSWFWTRQRLALSMFFRKTATTYKKKEMCLLAHIHVDILPWGLLAYSYVVSRSEALVTSQHLQHSTCIWKQVEPAPASIGSSSISTTNGVISSSASSSRSTTMISAAGLAYPG